MRAAAELIRKEAGGLDVLVNNAAIIGDGMSKPVGDVTAADTESVYATNVIGLVRVTHVFLPLLEAADHPVVVNVSSSGGSLTRYSAPTSLEASFSALAYSSSKSAVNMITLHYAKAFPGIRINAVNPGYTATGLNDHQGTRTVEEGAEIIVRMATIGADGPTGGFFEAARPVAW